MYKELNCLEELIYQSAVSALKQAQQTMTSEDVARADAVISVLQAVHGHIKEYYEDTQSILL